jgi:hypothetical protein
VASRTGQYCEDGGATWPLESIGTQLPTGTGSAFDVIACGSTTNLGSGRCGPFRGLDLSLASAGVQLNVLSAFTVETAPFIDSEVGTILVPFTVTTLSHLTVLIGGELDMGTKVSGASYLCANSGLPIIDIGSSSFGASGAAGLVNIFSAPSQPMV